MTNLVRAELLKIRTTSTWWWLALGAFLSIAIAFAFNAWLATEVFDGRGEEYGYTADQATAAAQAANIYTSGQFLGLMFVMLIGILMVTNEFFHQTATSTFLATPRRTKVIGSKLVAASILGFLFWLATTVIDLAAGAIFLAAVDQGPQLGEWAVQRALLFNLLAYAIWTILGVGIGTLITNQLGAVITAAVLYLIGTQVIGLLFLLLSNLLNSQAVIKWQVIWPAVASQVMIAGEATEFTPDWWVGALVLIGYAIVTGTIGIMLTRKRDIS
ncbi:ABC transporter permease [Micromonospora sp. NPDC126480]|uniref:ABC transporter permease n=1 Tax=Micromonospora sp. NPDC126480 TaxID=3155312 RepID=UPI0033214823